MPGNPNLEMSIADLIATCPYAGAALARRGMACVGCPMARFETVTEAAAAYGADPVELMRDVMGSARRSARPASVRGRKNTGRHPVHHLRKPRPSSGHSLSSSRSRA